MLAVMDDLSKDNQDDNSMFKNYHPKTELGKKLWFLRQKFLGS